MVSGGTEKAKESKRWLSGGSRLDYGEARFIGFGPQGEGDGHNFWPANAGSHPHHLPEESQSEGAEKI
jgi:hypothetical protein